MSFLWRQMKEGIPEITASISDPKMKRKIKLNIASVFFMLIY